jgi:site-specific DNA-methyltransferase (adenine-specific)
MTAPYYQDEWVTLYHGDCREVTEWLAADFLITDPPYGMNYEPTRRSNGSKRWGAERITGDAKPFDPAHLLAIPRAVLFGANWYADKLPASGGWIVWDKTPRGEKAGFTASHAELAWTNVSSLVRTFRLQWGGEARNGEGHYHPNQKPVGLLRSIIEAYSAPAEVIADPYAGSGSSLIAAREAGRRIIAVEIEEHYCETAARRLAQGVLVYDA